MLFTHKLFHFPFNANENEQILRVIKEENIFEFRKIEDLGERLVEIAESGQGAKLRSFTRNYWEYIKYLERYVTKAVLLCIKHRFDCFPLFAIGRTFFR